MEDLLLNGSIPSVRREEEEEEDNFFELESPPPAVLEVNGLPEIEVEFQSAIFPILSVCDKGRRDRERERE